MECTSNEMKLQSGYRLSLVKVIQLNRHMNRKDAPGSPSCPSHTRAATCSPLVTYPPPSRPEGRAQGTPVGIHRIPRPSACLTVWHGMEHVLPRQSHKHLRQGLQTGLMARPSACQEFHVLAMPCRMALHRCTCRRQTIPRNQLKPN